jgi:hypothetical protein
MKLKNIALVSMMSLFIFACGGGGDSSKTSIPTTVAVVEEPVVAIVIAPVVTDIIEPDPNAIYDTTADLIASKSFLLEQEYALAVSYKSDDSRNAYLSVCTDFNEGVKGIKVNYNSCLLRTSIESDYAGTLMIPNDQNSLVMAIWYLDDTKNPRYEVWNNGIDSNAERKFEVN